MVRVCAVKWCRNSNETGHSIHEFPSDLEVRRLWVEFVRLTRPHFPHPEPASVICQNHFTGDDYTNWGQYVSGFAGRLILKRGSIPTVHPLPMVEQPSEDCTGDQSCVHTPTVGTTYLVVNSAPKRGRCHSVTANQELARGEIPTGAQSSELTMRMSGRGNDPDLAEVDLMMECVEEELLPWQQEANALAEKAYLDVCREIDDAKRRLIENQVQRQQHLLVGGTTGVQPTSAVVPNQTAPVPVIRPESPDVIIVDDDVPSPPPSVPSMATRQQHRLLSAPPAQNFTPMSLFQRGPSPVILPLSGNGIPGSMLLMQPARMMTPVQVGPPHKLVPVLQHPPAQPSTSTPSQRGNVPSQRARAPPQPNIQLISRAPNDVSSPVPNTHGLGVRCPVDFNPSPPPAKRKHRTPSNKDTQVSGDWVPLDEYYYGKKEGDPSYVEEKGEYRFKCWYCNKMLYSNLRVMSHMQGHIDSEKQLNLELCDITQCKHCYKQFDTPFEMQCHIEKVHQNKSNVLVCRICEKDHDSKSVLQNHMRQCHNLCEMPYICHLCNFRSSIYSDVVDHFKKRHNSSGYILCVYCLRIFKTHFSKMSGWGFTSTYYQHLLRHQCKNSNKKCRYCKLTFINKADVKAHCKSDHLANLKGILAGSNAGATLTADKEQVMIQLPDSVCRSGGDKRTSSELKSLNVQSVSKLRDFADLGLAVESWHICVECKMPMNSANHFKKYIECSMCRYATICSAAYANHMINFHSRSAQRRGDCVPQDRKMPATMYCLCGYDGSRGNSIANHLVLCSKRTCYSQKPEIRWVEHDDKDEEFGSSDGHSEADTCDAVTTPERGSYDPVTERDSTPEPGEITDSVNSSMRASYDTSFKLKVIQKSVELGSNRKAAAYFGINEKQVRSWRGVSEKLRETQATTRRMCGAGRPVIDKSLDDKMMVVIREMQAKGDAILWTVVQQRARELSNDPHFKASGGWLHAFKVRHGFTATPEMDSSKSVITEKDVPSLFGALGLVKKAQKQQIYKRREMDSSKSVVTEKDVPSLFGALGLMKKAQKHRIYKRRGCKRTLPVALYKTKSVVDEKPQKTKPKWMSAKAREMRASRSKYSIFDGGIRSTQSANQPKQKSTTADVAARETNGGTEAKEEAADDAANTDIDVAGTGAGVEDSTEGTEERDVSPSSTADGAIEDVAAVRDADAEGGTVSAKNRETATEDDLLQQGSSVDRTSKNGEGCVGENVSNDATSLEDETEDSVLNSIDDTTTTTMTTTTAAVTTTTTTRPMEEVNDNNSVEENSSSNDRASCMDKADTKSEDSVKSCDSASRGDTETEGQLGDKTVTEPETSAVAEAPTDALETESEIEQRNDTGSANTSYSDSAAGDGINLISLSPMKSNDKEPVSGPVGSVDTSQSVDSLASSETETHVQRDSETTPSSASESVSTADKSSLEEPAQQDITGRVLEESPFPSPQEEKPVTGVASKSSSSSTREKSCSENSERRSEHGNQAGDHSNKSSSYSPYDHRDQRDHNRHDGFDRRRDRHHGDDRDRHRDHSRDRYSNSPRDRYDRDGNRSDRNNQWGNRNHHDNRGYYGDSGYGRKNADRHGNRRGGGRGGYYGSQNYY